jgi:hypothetical protein
MTKYNINDEVYWNDPDEGITSGYGTVTDIKAGQDPAIYVLYMNDGFGMLEAFEHELD